MGYKRPGAIFILRGPLSLLMRRKRQNVDPKVDRANALAGRKGRTGDHGGRHREGPIRHWDQTRATFPFLQEIVDSTPFSRKPAARLVHFGLSPIGVRWAPAFSARWRSRVQINLDWTNRKTARSASSHAKIGTLLAIGQQVRHDKLYPPLEWLGRPPFAAAKAHDRAMAVTNSERWRRFSAAT